MPRVPAGAMDCRRRRCDGVQPYPHARANACAHARADDGADKRADHGTHYGTDAVAHALAHAASMRCVVMGYLASLLHELRRWHKEARAQYPGQRGGAWRAMPGPFTGARVQHALLPSRLRRLELGRVGLVLAGMQGCS